MTTNNFHANKPKPTLTPEQYAALTESFEGFLKRYKSRNPTDDSTREEWKWIILKQWQNRSGLNAALRDTFYAIPFDEAFYQFWKRRDAAR